MKWNEIIKDSAWVVHDLLTNEECEYMLKRAVDLGIESQIPSGDTRHRNLTTVAFDDANLADILFERIRAHIPQEVIVDAICSNMGIQSSNGQLCGRLKPYSLNMRWRVACYPGKGHFGPHRDGSYIVDDHHRSLITINGFLTDRPAGFGGATRFIKDDMEVSMTKDGIFTTSESDVLHRVEAEQAGSASVFFHDLMHDGEPLKDGSPPKWLFRTEIMYERDSGSAPELTPGKHEARKVLCKAEDAEIEGDIRKAIALYNKAYKLDPALES